MWHGTGARQHHRRRPSAEGGAQGTCGGSGLGAARRGADGAACPSTSRRARRGLRGIRPAAARQGRRLGRSRVVRGGGAEVVSAVPARGEVWWCELPEVARRPVIVLSRDTAIPRLRNALIGPCTTT